MIDREIHYAQLDPHSKSKKGKFSLPVNIHQALGLEPYENGTFDFSENLIKTMSGDFKQASEEF